MQHISQFHYFLRLSNSGKESACQKTKKQEKNLPASLLTLVRSLDQEDPLEKEMATHSSIIALEIPWIEGAWWATVQGLQKSRKQLSD